MLAVIVGLTAVTKTIFKCIEARQPDGLLVGNFEKVTVHYICD